MVIKKMIPLTLFFKYNLIEKYIFFVILEP